MKNQGYVAEIRNAVSKHPYDELIRTEDIAAHLASSFSMPYDKAKAAANVALKRMIDRGELKRIQKGIFCRVRHTAFGITAPDINKLMAKSLTVNNGNRIGYESGTSLLNRIGLSTLMPRIIEITTNQYGTQLPDNCCIRLKKPVTEITTDNWKYLQFIDIAKALPDSHIDAEDPKRLLMTIARKEELDPLTLIITARKHYPAKTVLWLTDLIMEGQYESASGYRII